MHENTGQIVEIKPAKAGEGKAWAKLEGGTRVFLPSGHGKSVGDRITYEQKESKEGGEPWYCLKQERTKPVGGGGFKPAHKANEASIAAQTLTKVAADIYGKLIPPFGGEVASFDAELWKDIAREVVDAYARTYKLLEPTHNGGKTST